MAKKRKIWCKTVAISATLVIILLLGWKFRQVIRFVQLLCTREANLVSARELNDFELDDGKEYKLINSAIKQNYNIHFNGEITTFDTLYIGKGDKRYCSSYLEITKDSISIYKIPNTAKNAFKHNLQLTGNLIVNIERKADSTHICIVNETDSFQITSDFIGMDNPFVRSAGSKIKVKQFAFTCDDYNSDVYIFGDSYVNVSNPARWTYYIYNNSYKFFCDGLPGGKSIDSYDYLQTALTVHKPKYVIWCLGMNDGSDHFGLSSALAWKIYLKKVMELCRQNDIMLILSTVPSCPNVDNRNKNKFVRQSGYRYIDFDKALSDAKGHYIETMFADGCHPTEDGAKALAAQFVKDFPEIKEYMR